MVPTRQVKSGNSPLQESLAEIDIREQAVEGVGVVA
jgi:hypothetical protein